MGPTGSVQLARPWRSTATHAFLYISIGVFFHTTIPAKIAAVYTSAEYVIQSRAHPVLAPAISTDKHRQHADMGRTARRPSKQVRELGTVARVDLVKEALVGIVPDDVEEVHHAWLYEGVSIATTRRSGVLTAEQDWAAPRRHRQCRSRFLPLDAYQRTAGPADKTF